MPSDAHDFLLGTDQTGFLEDQEGFLSAPVPLNDGINVGVGRNLTKKPLTDEELNIIGDDLISRGAPDLPLDPQLSGIDPQAIFLSQNAGRRILKGDILDAEQEARSVIGDNIFDTLDAPRQAFLTNLAFNVGQGGLSGFTEMIGHIVNKDFDKATKAFFDSTRAGNRVNPKTGTKKPQVAKRRLAAEAFLLQKGQFPKDRTGKSLIKQFTGPGQIPPEFIHSR